MCSVILLMVIFRVVNKRLHVITQYFYNIMIIWSIDIFGDLLILSLLVRMRLQVLDNIMLLSHIFSQRYFIVLFYFII